MRFVSPRKVRFADCDPAGIVFFPQYLVMVNNLHEQWFDDALFVPYAELIGRRRTGMPTVRLEVDFTAVSRHGDLLRQELVVNKLGRSSIELTIEMYGDTAGENQLRLRARQVLVCTDLNSHRPQPLPLDIRAAMQPFVLQNETP
jgi:4-hydroxybenzoyl-CoA thioesterase